MNKQFFALLLMLVAGWHLYAQHKKLHGVVTNASDGKPVPGVSVLVKGTNAGTVTSLDGRYSLMVPDEASVIVYSFVGMKTQEFLYAGQLSINAVMQNEAVDMDEVFVVAYGTATKASFTGSASRLHVGKLLTSKTESLDKALAGKVSGVRVASLTGDPGAGGEVQIRGIGSINGSTQPLYVIDGIPMVTGDFGVRVSGNILSTINPDDIASMTILKDAAAAALYGSRAANGVIVITTRKGTVGSTRFNLKINRGWSDMATDSYKMMSGVQFAGYHKASLEGYYLNKQKALVPGQPNYGNVNIQADAKEFAEVNYLNPEWSTITGVRNGEDWQELIYNGGSDQDYQFSASGGNEKNDFYASLGIKKIDAIVRRRSFERYSSALNVNNKACKWIDLGFNTKFSYTAQTGRGDQSDQKQGMSSAHPVYLLYSALPTVDAYNADGSYNMDASYVRKVKNALYVLTKDEAMVTNKTYRALSNVSAGIKILPGISFKTTNSVDYVEVKSFNYWGPNSLSGASYNGLGEKQDNQIITLTSVNMFSYTASFNDTHNVNGILGMEVEDYSNDYLFASVSNYSTDKLPELENGQARRVTGKQSNRFMMSYIGNVNYNNADKYYFGASLRSDKSSQLGAGNRRAVFYSASAAWRFTQEIFLKNKFITDGKLRLSYGTNGALPVGAYSHLGLYNFGGVYGNASAIYLSQLANNELGWESSRSVNIGSDLTLLNRITLSLEYYNKYTKDLLLYVPSSYLTGVDGMWQNSGEISNCGLEFELHGLDLLRSVFKWDADFTLTTLQATVEKLPGSKDIILGDGNFYLYRENEDLYTFYLPTYAGVDPVSGLAQFLIDPSKPANLDNLTYNYSEAQRGPQGSSYPRISGGFFNSVRWKGVSLGVLLTYQFGGKLFDYPGYFTHHDGFRNSMFNLHADVAGNYWTQTGDVVDNPRPVYKNTLRSDNFSTRHLHSTDHIRLKELTLSYMFPKQWYRNTGIENLNVSFNVNNLAYIYAATKDMELEVALNGYRTADTPLARTSSLGVNVEF